MKEKYTIYYYTVDVICKNITKETKYTGGGGVYSGPIRVH